MRGLRLRWRCSETCWCSARRSPWSPLPVWEKVTVPALVYEGALDRYVPAQESATIIEAALRRAGNRDYTIKVFPQANHGMWLVETGAPTDRLISSVDRGFLRNWLLHHVTVAK